MSKEILYSLHPDFASHEMAYLMSDIELILLRRLSKNDIKAITQWASQSSSNRQKLFTYAFSDEDGINTNALWCLTHLRKSDATWLQSQQNFLINSLLQEKTTARRRMLLQLLRDQKYNSENMRVDFLDYCLSKINSESDQYAIRCFSLYIAFKICRHYPELLSELQERIAILSCEPLSPGLKCAIRKVSYEMKKIN